MHDICHTRNSVYNSKRVHNSEINHAAQSVLFNLDKKRSELSVDVMEVFVSTIETDLILVLGTM